MTTELIAPRAGEPPTNGQDGEPDDRGPVGICVSGGGIRAAAFGLGALEALEKQKGIVQGGDPEDPKDPADYLVAVSGGSYIVGAITMLRSKFDPAADSASTNEDQMNRNTQRVAEDNPRTSFPQVFEPGTDETEYVRRRAQYLLRAQGGWAELVTEVVIRLLLNLVFVLLPFAIVGWIAGRVYEWRIPELPNQGVGPIGLALAIGFVILGLAVLITIPPLLSSSLATGRHRHWVTVLICLAMLTFVIALLPVLISALGTEEPTQAAAAASQASGSTNDSAVPLTIVATIGAVITAIAALWARAEPIVTAVGRFPKVRTAARKAARALIAIAAALFAPIAIAAFFVAMAQFGAEYQKDLGWTESLALAGLTGLYVAMLVLVEPTTWSLHPFYKRRLQSCFCLGWCAKDGLKVSERDARPKYVWSGWDLPEKPEVIIAAAANISTFGGSPAGLNVLPFTISQHEIGFSNGWTPAGLDREEPSAGSGSRLRTEQLIASCQRGNHAIRLWLNGRRNVANLTIPAAVAITGAAVSPSMGKRTIAPVRMLLAMFNFRLGVWLPNPEHPKVRDAVINGRGLERSPAARHLIGEFLGLNRRNGSFVYVSDGGHYENLGLVETLRRNCKTVYCIDASGDPPGDPRTLTEAMRLAEAELNIQWRGTCTEALNAFALEEPTDGNPDPTPRHPRINRTWTTLEFDDADGSRGRVHVIKAGLCASTPQHLQAYEAARGKFPYDGTGNQLFRADRFDAYRQLGYCSTMSFLADVPTAVPVP